MTDLLSLAAIVEKAEIGSRELDARIYKFSQDAIEWQMEAYEVPNHRRFAPRWRIGFIDGHKETDDPLPKYTTSVDAALSLVPEGWEPSIGVYYGDAHCSLFKVIEADGVSGRIAIPTVPRVKSRTLALAISAASLRALSHERDL